MKATVTKAFPGVPDGAIYPRLIEAGQTITGALAAAAVGAGWASADTKGGPGVAAPQRDAAVLTRRQAILLAAEGLDTNTPGHFMADGRPQVKALETALGYDITAQERDIAWASRAKPG